MAKHEQSIEEHVRGNVDMAIDQAGEYGGLEGAFFSFLQNTRDSCIEDGYTIEEAYAAGQWFQNLFASLTGFEF